MKCVYMFFFFCYIIKLSRLTHLAQVCIPQNAPRLFIAEVTFQSPGGQALKASSLQKGSVVRAANGLDLEVLDEPRELFVDDFVELWAGDVILQVVPEHGIQVAEGSKNACDLQAGDLIFVDGQQAALIRVERKTAQMAALQMTLSPGIPELFSRRLSDESLFALAV